MERRSLFARTIQDFRHARGQAALEQLIARLRRRSAELLPFEEVRQKLQLAPTGVRKVDIIPLDAIVGSVGRYTDFTRSYWPIADNDEQRWAKVKMAINDMVGLPPIEVYQIGEAYFVKDGNHRVSVYREMGATHIQAYVTELATKVPLSPNDDIDDVIIKSEYVEFLKITQLDTLRPKADIRLSVPGAYKSMEEHIRIYQKYLSQEQNRDVPLQEAVIAWYDGYYSVVVRAIARLGILRDFPNHTEGDIYMLVWEHRGILMEETSIDVSVDLATQDLVDRKGISAQKLISRFTTNLLKIIFPREFSAGPPPGKWREQTMTMKHRKDCLFGFVLVPMSSDPHRQVGLEQAILIARRENSTLYGLHILSSHFSGKSFTAEIASRPRRTITGERSEIQTIFEERCENAGVEGAFIYAKGKISYEIIERARWTDLVVMTLSHPPGKSRLAKFTPGFDALIRASSTPILAVPSSPSQLHRALLAFDGSPKAREALFIAVYMVHRWNTELVILTVPEKDKPSRDDLDNMHRYLNNEDIKPIHIEGNLPVPKAIVETAADLKCDLIIMGGYGKDPVFEMLLGSAVDEVLRNSLIPILVCR